MQTKHQQGLLALSSVLMDREKHTADYHHNVLKQWRQVVLVVLVIVVAKCEDLS